MGYWDQRGRPAIMAAVEDACDAIAVELATEEVERLRAGAAKADQLGQENRLLSQQLDELRKNQKQMIPTPMPVDEPSSSHQDAAVASCITPPMPCRQAVQLSARPALAEITPNKPIDPTHTASIFEQGDPNWEIAYHKIANRYKSLEEAYQNIQKKARKFRDERGQWIKYAEKLEAKVQKLEERVLSSAAVAVDELRIRRIPENLQADDEPGAAQLVSSFISNPEASSRPRLHKDVVAQTRRFKRAASTPSDVPTQSTSQAETEHVPHLAGEDTSDESDMLPPLPQTIVTEQQAVVKQEPPSDGPVVVSARSLHKRKNIGGGRQLPPARRIKSEHFSSDPVVTGEALTFSPHESLDLDAGQGKMPTPKKQRHVDIQTPDNEVANAAGMQQQQRYAASVMPESNSKPSKTHSSRKTDLSPGWCLETAVADVAEDGSIKPPGTTSKTKQTGRLQTLLSPNTPAGDLPSPLRERPPAQLRLEDFKINPRFNNGHSHAFSEVVRGKADRAGLAGCTDPKCCGKTFGAIARSELDAGGPAILSRAADIKLLEDFLGDEAYKLVVMTPQEKQDTWLEAKTQDLANRYGKHRHRFARRPSPPGYWDPDFPTTQEVKDRKEEGEREERGLVEERWREAMRGGRALDGVMGGIG
ncbi:DNA repair protein endonuclease SAE2/CtIP C-terminus-domain-containing protein [Bombardia bombarda]|uniref:DNA repair protein endonuclease SAE2/CtIP C-terminus-domain-containing protein n=1 Tax=Bombardia bombarda TaxID=252184 RepID=A0AA39XMC5_9PEZI|nr:DNA repair protein endonuclease SAE2/CtIP C-terminus-domain-containing protein [Bombardia bombarda]